MLETEEEQDITIGVVADAEAEGEFEFTSDSSDDDYHQPIPDLPPQTHDHEARSSSSIDLSFLAILDRSRPDVIESRPP
jgi:hypothetical protein